MSVTCITRVLIVDDHEVLRDGLANLLGDEDDLEVVGQAATSSEALAAATATQPDVVLLDHRLPDGDALATTERLQAVSPQSKIVVFTASDDPRLVSQVAAAGCAAFLTKAASGAEVMSAVRAAASGEPFEWSVEVADDDALSPRERAVLQLTAAGLDNRAIGRELFLSVNTVRNHQQRILSKLGAHSKLEAVAIAAELGLVARGPHAV